MNEQNNKEQLTTEQLELVRQQLSNELALISYKTDKTQFDVQDVRRDIRELNRTIDRLRDEIRNSRRSEVSDIITSLFPILAITLPTMFLVFMLFLTKILK